MSDAPAQPINSRDGRYSLLFNGEIYNYMRLLNQGMLEGAESASDTLALIRAIEHYGREVLGKLQGMYAIVLYDRQRHEVTLARDHFGIKPVFFRVIGDRLFFASTLDSLQGPVGGTRDLDAEYVRDFLVYGHGLKGRTPFLDAEAVEPGTALTFRLVEGSIHRVRTEVLPGDVAPDVSDEEVVRDSVSRHLLADVPVGIFLSGGVDSALVAAYATERHPAIRSFSIGFPGSPSLDESDSAEAVAAALGTQHESIPFPIGRVAQTIRDCFAAFDVPCGDPAALPTLELSRVASEYVKVVLTGEGGDELFGGYRRYYWHSRMGDIPRGLRRAVAKGAQLLGRPRVGYLLGWDDWVGGYGRWLATGHDRLGDDDRFRRQAWGREDWHGWSRQSVLREIDVSNRLAESYMLKLDRSTMFYSIEGRVPLLDSAVLDLASRLDERYLAAGRSVGKPWLRMLLSPFVDASIINRKKKGFGVPLDSVFQAHGVPELVAEITSEARAAGGLASTLARMVEDSYGSRSGYKRWLPLALLGWAAHRNLLHDLANVELPVFGPMEQGLPRP